MRWQGRRESANVEDRRGSGMGSRLPIGGRGGIMGGGIGAIILVVLALIFGFDPSFLLQMGGGPTSYEQPQTVPGSGAMPGQIDAGGSDDLKRFVAVVLAETEDTWNQIFTASNKQYQEPQLVLFNGAVDSACGYASAAVGPFYCPGDQKVYLDLAFFREMEQRFGAQGDFAKAYVIAHEVGHHVQTLLGISPRVEAMQRQVSKVEANQLLVRLELQADCFAGVWAHRTHARTQILEQGDIEEALNAANAIGDDRMQRRAQGYVVPDSFTHGSSEQRVRWFRRGLEAGKPGACDTFAAAQL
ncbi:MAG TPA: neutral zinc metallopeptidase [Defluviicoccus sp.]|nr:neutral zinc metallopeptidase [Defluviicoccus sp.]